MGEWMCFGNEILWGLNVVDGDIGALPSPSVTNSNAHNISLHSLLPDNALIIGAFFKGTVASVGGDACFVDSSHQGGVCVSLTCLVLV